MRFEYDPENKITQPYTSENDNCYNCALQEICPLVLALAGNYVYPATEQLTISRCVLYDMLQKVHEER